MSRTPRRNSANKKRLDKLFLILIVAFIALVVFSCWWRNEHQRALTDYDQAIQRQPGYADVYADRGLAYYALGENQHCLRDCEQALVLNNRLARAYVDRGLVHYSLHE